MNGFLIWMKVATTVGVPAAIAFFLLAMLAGIIPSPISETAAMMHQHKENGEIQTRLLRQICRQGAKSDSALIECER